MKLLVGVCVAMLLLLPHARPADGYADETCGRYWPSTGKFITQSWGDGTDIASFEFILSDDEIAGLRCTASNLEIEFRPLGVEVGYQFGIIPVGFNDYYVASTNLPGAIRDVAYLDVEASIGVTGIDTKMLSAGVSYHVELAWSAPQPTTGLFVRWVPVEWASPFDPYETNACAIGFETGNFAWCYFEVPLTARNLVDRYFHGPLLFGAYQSYEFGADDLGGVLITHVPDGSPIQNGCIENSAPCVSDHDFDGDSSADPTVYNNSRQDAAGRWKAEGATLGDLGGAAWTPAPCDYDGDGIADLAIFNHSDHQDSRGFWKVRYSASGVTEVEDFGGPAYDPYPADYDGDGLCDKAIYAPSEGRWRIRFAAGGFERVDFGGPAWTPVPGDYDGDGVTDLALYNHSDTQAKRGYWKIIYSSTGVTDLFDFGGPAWTPVPGDYNGDGTTDVVVYNDSTQDSAGRWKMRGIGTLADFGGPAWTPVPGDYDGDGITELAIYNHSDHQESRGHWRIKSAPDATAESFDLGGPAWIPVNTVQHLMNSASD